MNPPALRNAIFNAIFSTTGTNRIPTMPPANYGPSTHEFIVGFQTLLRENEGRIIVLGAVATKTMYEDKVNATRFHVDDLTNGTGLATLKDRDTIECDGFILDRKSVADIIWVIDESGSMDDNRKNIVANAKDFFTRAVNSGLDFRMGITSTAKPDSVQQITAGKFCSEISTDVEDDGGDDRFLLPSEQAIFDSCIENPPFYENSSEYGLANAWTALTTHLPRQPMSANDETKIREEAELAIIIVSDEVSEEITLFNYWTDPDGNKHNGVLAGVNIFDPLAPTEFNINQCTSSKQPQIDDFVKDWITLFKGNHPTWGAAAKATVHLIGGVCQQPCGFAVAGPDFPYGYIELVRATGGQHADICQADLGSTLQLIIDSIVGASSNSKLQFVPMSASLAVAINEEKLDRSREKGFDYDSGANTIVLFNYPFEKGDKMVVSYRRWVDQGEVIE